MFRCFPGQYNSLVFYVDFLNLSGIESRVAMRAFTWWLPAQYIKIFTQYSISLDESLKYYGIFCLVLSSCTFHNDIVSFDILLHIISFIGMLGLSAKCAKIISPQTPFQTIPLGQVQCSNTQTHLSKISFSQMFPNYVYIFSCPDRVCGQLNRWHCHSLNQWLSHPPFDFWH